MNKKEMNAADIWKSFEDTALKGSGITQEHNPVQYREMKRAFYAGMFALFGWFIEQLDEDLEPTDNDMARVEALNLEMQQFFVDEGLVPIEKTDLQGQRH